MRNFSNLFFSKVQIWVLGVKKFFFAVFGSFFTPRIRIRIHEAKILWIQRILSTDFKGTVVNRILPPMHAQSLEIPSTVPYMDASINRFSIKMDASINWFSIKYKMDASINRFSIKWDGS